MSASKRPVSPRWTIALLAVMLLAPLVALCLGSTAAASGSSQASMGHHLPSKLEQVIEHRLGHLGPTERFASDGGLHLSDGAATWSLVPTSFARVGSPHHPLSSPRRTMVSGEPGYDFGPLASWYRDASSGVEQGFQVTKRLSGSSTRLVALDLTSSGSVSPRLNGSSVLLVNAAGQAVFSYGSLRVSDARGRPLASHFSVHGKTVGIVIDDGDGVYPLTIDPLAEQVELVASDGQANDQFGSSNGPRNVALSANGSVAVVGVPFPASGGGKVYVFSGSDWGTETELTEGVSGDAFGLAVAVSGDGSTVVVGAQNAGTNGKVYVFSGSDWGTETTLVPSAGTSDNFGQSVATNEDGSLIVIGAPGEAVSGNASQGVTYLFSGTNWGISETFTAADGQAGDNFGEVMAMSSDGSTIAIGTPAATSAGDAQAGKFYVLHGANYTSVTEIQPPIPQTGGNFAWSLALSSNGDDIAVGTGNMTDGYVYSGTNWGTVNDLVPSDLQSGQGFANMMAISADGSEVFTAQSGTKVGTTSGEGEAYVFSGSNWGTETDYLSPAPGLDFGSALAMGASGSVLLVTQPNTTVGTHAYQGAAYIFAAPASLDAALSTIVASPTTLSADGTSTSTITVQAKDSSGADLTTGGAAVVLSTTDGTLSAVTDNGNGTYSATLTAPTSVGTATVSGTISGTAIGTDATVIFTASITTTTAPPTTHGSTTTTAPPGTTTKTAPPGTIALPPVVAVARSSTSSIPDNTVSVSVNCVQAACVGKVSLSVARDTARGIVHLNLATAPYSETAGETETLALKVTRQGLRVFPRSDGMQHWRTTATVTLHGGKTAHHPVFVQWSHTHRQ